MPLWTLTCNEIPTCDKSAILEPQAYVRPLSSRHIATESATEPLVDDEHSALLRLFHEVQKTLFAWLEECALHLSASAPARIGRTSESPVAACDCDRYRDYWAPGSLQSES